MEMLSLEELIQLVEEEQDRNWKEDQKFEQDFPDAVKDAELYQQENF